jgi:hypothetical protein
METDEKFFRRVRRERVSTPHVHEMLGQLGWKTIQRGGDWHRCKGARDW